MSRLRGKRQVTGINKCPSPAKKRRTNNVPNQDMILDSLSLRRIKCPKKEESSSLVDIKLDGKVFEKEIQPIIQRSFKRKDKFKDFNISECRDMRNAAYETEYGQKRNELRHQSVSKDGIGDQYGFLYTKSEDKVKEWCEKGVLIGNASDSRIGKPELGVTIAQHVDYVCPNDYLPREGWICIVKYFKGRTHLLHESFTPLDPQPGYDCHISNGQINSNWSKGNLETFFSTQVYLYEYSDECEVKPRPRHVLPFAAVRYRCLNWASNRPRDFPLNNVNRYRLALQKERDCLLIESVKSPIPNRQHPGVPLVLIKPKPPPLISQSIRDVTMHSSPSPMSKHLSKRLSTSSSGMTSPLTPAAPAPTPDGEKAFAEKQPLHTQSSTKEALEGKKNHSRNRQQQNKTTQKQSEQNSQGSEKGVKQQQTRRSSQEQSSKQQPQQKTSTNADVVPKVPERQPTEKAEVQQSEQLPLSEIHQRLHIPAPVPQKSTQQRPDRPNKNIGQKHFSEGHIVSFFKLKAGDHFQAKMDLVSYADKLVFPLAVLSPKLSIRKFISMSKLRAVDLLDAKVSIKEEFLCPNCDRFAMYYRIYLRQNTSCRIEMSKLCDYMRRREVVGVVHFTNESQEMLMFPDGEFAENIGIPAIDKSPITSSLFLHCLLLSPQPQLDYYRQIVRPIVGAENEMVDEVLATYIWADEDLPALDEADAALLGSYGGEWPCEEAVHQLFEFENEIQNRYLFGSCGRRRSCGDEGLSTYQKLDFTRPVVEPRQEPTMNNYCVEIRNFLSQIQAVQQQKQEQELRMDEDDEERGDWHGKEKDIHGGMGTVFKSLMPNIIAPSTTACYSETGSSTPPPTHYVDNPSSPPMCSATTPSPREVRMVSYTKRVFEEPPSSPGSNQEQLTPSDTRQVLVEKNLSVEGRCNTETIEPATSLHCPPKISDMTINLRKINVEINQHSPGTGENMTNASVPPLIRGAGNGSRNSDIGKMLNVIRKSIYLGTNTEQASTDANKTVTGNCETQAFNAYEMQNRAAQEARERVQQPLLFGSDDSNGTPPGDNNDITEDEIHRVLDERFHEQSVEWKRRQQEDSSSQEHPAENMSTRLPNTELSEVAKECEEPVIPKSTVMSQTQPQCLTSSANTQNTTSSPARVLPSGSATGMTSTTSSPGLATRRDRRFLRHSGIQTRPLADSSTVSSPRSLPRFTPSPRSPRAASCSPPRRGDSEEKSVASISRVSSMSISSGSDDGTEVAAEEKQSSGNRIPVMVSRRITGDESLLRPRIPTSTTIRHFPEGLTSLYAPLTPIRVPTLTIQMATLAGMQQMHVPMQMSVPSNIPRTTASIDGLPTPSTAHSVSGQGAPQMAAPIVYYVPDRNLRPTYPRV